MPQLLNRRHELFARALASGESASTAYRAAGYQCAPHKARGHGHRLRTREDIAARVQELIDKPQNRIATQQIVEATRTGRPTIYRPELATLARKLALLGATDQEMADALGIDQGTLDRWKTRHKEFRIAIQHGKIRADAEIAQSLYNRARGMSLPAVKIFQGTPEGGPVIVPHREHLPPDVGAAKLWLSRRQPEKWRERREVNVTGSFFFCSSRCVAKLCRSVCRETGLSISAICAAAWQARLSWRGVSGLTGFCPGNSQP